MSAIEAVEAGLRASPRTWLVTGVAGFIGSHLLHRLLGLQQSVVGLDNFATGHQRNLERVRSAVDADAWRRFTFIEGDIRNLEDCDRALVGVDVVLHQAALGSVPRSVENPIRTNAANIDGFLNVLWAAHRAGLERVVYAASSSTYGDHPALPKREEIIGAPLSPYAVTKYVNELYAGVFAGTYGLNTVGLRYFNVFGPGQKPDGAYAAVIPRWISALLEGRECQINGDGETSRDFCYVENAVQANLLAATTDNPGALNEVYNVAVGGRTTLKALYEIIQGQLAAGAPHVGRPEPLYADFRGGDVRHSQADITKATQLLGYDPQYDVRAGLVKTCRWYLDEFTGEG